MYQTNVKELKQLLAMTVHLLSTITFQCFIYSIFSAVILRYLYLSTRKLKHLRLLHISEAPLHLLNLICSVLLHKNACRKDVIIRGQHGENDARNAADLHPPPPHLNHLFNEGWSLLQSSSPGSCQVGGALQLKQMMKLTCVRHDSSVLLISGKFVVMFLVSVFVLCELRPCNNNFTWGEVLYLLTDYVPVFALIVSASQPEGFSLFAGVGFLPQTCTGC